MALTRIAAVICIWFIACLSFAQAVNVTFTAPTQCRYMNISWTGGQPPFQFNFVSVFGRQVVESVPSSAYQDGEGFYQTQLQYSSGTQFVFLLQDATGVPTGGTSNTLSVGPSVGGPLCDTTPVNPDFIWQPGSFVTECQPFQFSELNNGTTQPVTIVGIIPGSQVFNISVPTGSSAFDWTANLPGFTTVLFTAIDGAGRRGGVSFSMTVTQGSSSCLTSGFPASPDPPAQVATLLPPTSSSTSTSSSAGSSTSLSSSKTDAGHSGKTLVAIIVAVCVGSLIIIAAILIFTIRWKRRKARRSQEPTLDMAEDSALENHVITPFPHPMKEWGPHSSVAGSLHNVPMTNLSMHSGVGQHASAIFPSYHPLSNGSGMTEAQFDLFEPPDYDTATGSAGAAGSSSNSSVSPSRARLNQGYRVTNRSSTIDPINEKATMFEGNKPCT